MTEHEALLKIARLIAPYVSTRFADGESLADDIEQVLREVGIRLHDGEARVEVSEPDAPWTKAEMILHNHVTRDIKPRGECPSCDVHHMREALRGRG